VNDVVTQSITDDVGMLGCSPFNWCSVFGRDNCKWTDPTLETHGYLSSTRALLTVGLDASGAGGLGARVNMAFVLHVLV
jgi:hypothetical protein